MAANDYYHSSSNNNAFGHDAPLPPIPSHSPAPSRLNSVVSPVSATATHNPFNDPHSNPYNQQIEHGPSTSYNPYPNDITPGDSASQLHHSDSTYWGAGAHDEGRYNDDIPLRPQGSTMGADASTSKNQFDPNTHNAYDQPYYENALPGPHGGKQGGKRKWYNRSGGAVPWVVYILTLAQLTVFIVELVRNCRFPVPLLFHNQHQFVTISALLAFSHYNFLSLPYANKDI
jgi:hypothetical protein